MNIITKIIESILNIKWILSKSKLTEDQLNEFFLNTKQNRYMLSENERSQIDIITGEFRLRYDTYLKQTKIEDEIIMALHIYFKLLPIDDVNSANIIVNIMNNCKKLSNSNSFKLNSLFGDCKNEFVLEKIEYVSKYLNNKITEILCEPQLQWSNKIPICIETSTLLVNIYETSTVIFNDILQAVVKYQYNNNFYEDYISIHINNLINHCYKNFIMNPAKNYFDSLENLINKVKLLANICSTHETRTMFVLHPLFFNDGNVQKSSALLLNSIFGKLLSISLFENTSFGNAINTNGLKQKLESNMRSGGVPIKLVSEVEIAADLYIKYIEELTNLFKLLLKDTVDIRTYTLHWIIVALEVNSKQRKMGYIQALQFLLKQKPFMQKMFYQSQNIFEPVESFNLGLLMLNLFFPIKHNNLDKIEFDKLNLRGCDQNDNWSESNCIYKLIENTVTMADKDTIEFRMRNNDNKPEKFTTIIYHLCLECFSTFLSPWFQRIQEIEDILREEYLAEHSTITRKDLYAEIMQVQIVIKKPFVGSLIINYIDVLIAYIFNCIIPNCSRMNESDLVSNVIKIIKDENHNLSYNFYLIPTELFSEVFSTYMKITKIYCELGDSYIKTLSFQTLYTDDHIMRIMSICTFFLSASNNYTRMQTLRNELAVKFLELSTRTNYFINIFKKYDWFKKYLPLIIIRGIVNSNKMEDYLRDELRIRIILFIDKVFDFDSNEYEDFIFYSKETCDEYYEKYLNYFASFTSYMVEEALVTLSEIKRREDNNTTNSENNMNCNNNEVSTGTNNIGNEENMNLDTNNQADPQSVQEIPFAQLKTKCANYMFVANVSIRLLSKLGKATYNFISNSSIVLEPTVLALNSCLNSLVGPKCLSLKVHNYSQYNFNPHEMLSNLLLAYVKLVGDDEIQRKKALKAILEEKRYFDSKIFAKAVYITKRENLSSSEVIQKVEKICNDLLEAEKSDDILSEIQLNYDIPDEFLDPIMCVIMLNPVKLPTSGVIVEKSVIERHLVADEFDPFNRKPVTRKDLIPQEELKQKIEQFIRQCEIELEQKKKEKSKN